MKRKKLILVLMSLTIISLLAGCNNSEENSTVKDSVNKEIASELPEADKMTDENEKETKQMEEVLNFDKEADYLKAYYDVEFAGAEVDAAQFYEKMIQIMNSDNVEVTNWLTAVKELVKMSNYEELALSYTDEKTKRQLEAYGITDTIQQDGQYLACALDTELIQADDVENILNNSMMKREWAEVVLMNMLETRGEARNYLGYSEDEDIYSKIDHAWDSFILYNSEKLSELGNKAVQDKIVTGYNLKNKAYDAKFLPNLTLQYGHSDIKHAQQMIGLMNSEGIQAKIQLEPKVSVYEYLLEWGPIPETTPTYEVKQISDSMYLVYAIEYDMKMEFDDEEDMKMYDQIINEYAKKNEGNEEAKGLIYQSWWQPLYNTTYTGMPQDAYKEIIDCTISDEQYELHTFCLKEVQDTVMQNLKNIDSSVEVNPITRYCNLAFYNYLSGVDYQ